MHARKVQQFRKQHAGAQGLRGNDPDRAAWVVDVVADFPVGIIGHGKQLARADGQFFSGCGELQAIVLADEERLADAFFKRSHLFRHARLGQVYPFGGLCEAQRFHCRDEDFQLP
ncbi:hypothetical protein G6F57_023104 [Rhizopus arrhizus]|nr:hypothetical protein G6F57_023104 [Rhizopus arrhizus]